MRYHRRHDAGLDSLELMLDVICNLFGGIIFIAIVIALLTSDRIVATASPRRDAEHVYLSKLDFSEYQHEVEVLRKSVELLNGLQRLGQGQDLSKHLHQIKAASTKLKQQIDRVVEQRNRRREEFGAPLDRLRSRVEELRDLEKRLKSRYNEQARTAPKNNKRLPVEQITNRKQIILILTRSKIYVKPGGYAHGPAFAELLTHVVGKKNNSVTTKKDAGIPLQDVRTVGRYFRMLLAATDPELHFFDCYVFPDSVALFKDFLDQITRRGYRYNVHPATGAEPIRFYPVDRIFVQ